MKELIALSPEYLSGLTLENIAAADEEYDKRKKALERKQFERNKKIQIGQAITGGAVAFANSYHCKATTT